MLKRVLVIGFLAVCVLRCACAHVVVGIAESCPTSGISGVEGEYAATVFASGAVPLVLPATTNAVEIARMLDRVDVLLLAGGEDVESCRYGESDHGRMGKVNRRRDAWEFALLDEAIRRQMPILGICRGCQVLNVRFGGTLWQDVPSDMPGSVSHRLADNGEHSVSILSGSFLASLVTGQSISVNSRHHQAAKTVAPGFRVTAVSPDGVVEAIEGVSYPAIGVQFHPESLFVRRGRKEFLPLFRGAFGSAKTGGATEHVRR